MELINLVQGDTNEDSDVIDLTNQNTKNKKRIPNKLQISKNINKLENKFYVSIDPGIKNFCISKICLEQKNVHHEQSALWTLGNLKSPNCEIIKKLNDYFEKYKEVFFINRDIVSVQIEDQYKLKKLVLTQHILENLLIQNNIPYTLIKPNQLGKQFRETFPLPEKSWSKNKKRNERKKNSKNKGKKVFPFKNINNSMDHHLYDTFWFSAYQFCKKNNMNERQFLEYMEKNKTCE